jgi:O-methyltransferase
VVDAYEVKRLAKLVALHVPGLRDRLGPRYPYLHTPAQLAYLCACLEQTRDVPGSIVEAGAFQGNTTLFLNRHLSSEGIEKPYWAVDTFSGFRDDDLDGEVTRGQARDHYRGMFAGNDQRWFDHVVRRAGVTRVRSVAADVGSFDFERVGPIAFCLVDVVLYQPVKRALPHIWDALSPGGIIVVDDYHDDESGPFSGAGQAYREFADEHGMTPCRVHKEFGLLMKAPAAAQRLSSLPATPAAPGEPADHEAVLLHRTA